MNNIKNNLLRNENENKNILKKKYFNIYKDIQKKNVNCINKRFLNNEKKIIKYNKTVYINKYLIKEKKNNTTINRDTNNIRSSKYRGVSKNGIGWQTLNFFIQASISKYRYMINDV